VDSGSGSGSGSGSEVATSTDTSSLLEMEVFELSLELHADRKINKPDSTTAEMYLFKQLILVLSLL
tara:strand:- start:18 stop:215 length:198 start_codon:yes stop_codon:yes gene_type:complete